MSIQFFDKETFANWFGELKFDGIKLITTETFDETALASTIENLDKKVCLAVSLQLSIIGYGNRKFNTVQIDTKDLLIEDWFKTNGVNYTHTLNDKLKPGELTPRRLIRFYRFAIQQFLIENKHVQSYIFKKILPL